MTDKEVEIAKKIIIHNGTCGVFAHVCSGCYWINDNCYWSNDRCYQMRYKRAVNKLTEELGKEEIVELLL